MKWFAEKRQFFPNPALPTLDGIVAMGDELNLNTLFEAYSFGIFPWPHPELPCLWFCPDERGVLDFKELHISKSLKKELRKSSLRFTFNQSFSEVIDACSQQPRPGQTDTWITPEIKKNYLAFHKAGYAHSLECWEHDQLVGGIYGVYIAGVFSGESMFFKKSNASKLCLIKLIELLSANGLEWMDIQMVTSITHALGGKYITKHEFLERLKQSKERIRKNAMPLKLNLR